ncbi:hypothetical protein [Streptomyces flaveolus]|uniref:hypothetical protein n=1 Tax=Streptomyces flaveolus TaxID=67297 RepID=UPI0019891ED0|nr:hypothetical protein [Streptomyces flaveolus]GGQ98307.1 hypothetical protein GCM10010216_71000 [Streptomyces flaveolus]
MAAFLFLTLALAPFLTPFVVLGTAGVLAVRAWHWEPEKGLRMPGAVSCGLLAVLAGSAALGAYAYGVNQGFYILDPDQMCAAAGAPGDHVVTRMTLPVSAQCVTPDGVGTELVPGWVNPVVVTGLTVLVLALAAAVASPLLRARARPHDREGQSEGPRPCRGGGTGLTGEG